MAYNSDSTMLPVAAIISALTFLNKKDLPGAEVRRGGMAAVYESGFLTRGRGKI
jgi:hypothetical protein